MQPHWGCVALGLSPSAACPATIGPCKWPKLDSGALQRNIDAQAGDSRTLVWSADGTVLQTSYSGTHGVFTFTLDSRPLLDDRFPGPAFGVAIGVGGQAAVVSLAGTLRSYRVRNGVAAVTGTLVISWECPE